MKRHQRLVLEIIATDQLATPVNSGWSVPCIHCGSKSLVSASGHTALTIEHILPQMHGGGDDLRNIALACAECNQEKGRRHDWKRLDDPKRVEIQARLSARRLARWKDPDAQ